MILSKKFATFWDHALGSNGTTEDYVVIFAARRVAGESTDAGLSSLDVRTGDHRQAATALCDASSGPQAVKIGQSGVHDRNVVGDRRIAGGKEPGPFQ